MDTNTIFEAIKNVIFANKDIPNTEIEMRLGKFNGEFFDTNVGQKNFDTILQGLENYKEWEDKKTETVEVFYYNEGGKRVTWNEETGTKQCIMKQNIVKKDFKHFSHSPYDLRISLAREIPSTLNGDEEADRMIEKYRRSFIRKNLSIDMTIISGGITDMDDEDGKKFQIELEIIEPSKIVDEPQLFNIIQKVSDVLKILE
ncbi:hypothetical protein [Dishui Lake phycodnavirus 4]|nr:hypothetical protein [Dishui Lake phycodnavirus 4]